MKKILLSSILFSSLLFSEQIRIIPIDKSLLAQENGGNKSAIDAYSDGVGIITESNQFIDNSPMNELVFTYGEKAKNEGSTLKEYSLNNGDIKEKDLANKLGIGIETPVYVIGDSCDDGNSNTINDIYIDSSGTCKGSSYSLSCNDLKINEGKTTNGFYNILINGEISNVYCKMDIDSGGWTLLFNQETFTNSNQINSYSTDISLIKNSSETLIAYSDADFNLSKAVKFSTVSDWKNNVPFQLNNQVKNINYTVLSTQENKTGNLFVGKENFNSNCGDAFHTYSNPGFGKICIQNEINAPFLSGFNGSPYVTDTYCSDNQYYSNGKCSSNKKFVIFVK